jgi:hypothetical protein
LQDILAARIVLVESVYGRTSGHDTIELINISPSTSPSPFAKQSILAFVQQATTSFGDLSFCIVPPNGGNFDRGLGAIRYVVASM